MTYEFAFGTAFTKESILIEGSDYEDARRQFANLVDNKRRPTKVYPDYVWLLDNDGNALEKIK